MHRIRLRPSTPPLSRLLLIVVLLAAGDDICIAHAARVPFTCVRYAALVRPSSIARNTKRHRPRTKPNAFSLGLQSALQQYSVSPARAFSGGVPLPSPIHHWHHEFFRKVAIRLLPSSSQNQNEQQQQQQHGGALKATSSDVLQSKPPNSDFNVVDNFIQGIKSTINNFGARRDASTKSESSVANTNRHLTFWEAMVCGAVSRSISQTLTHPANAAKTILQSDESATIQSLLQKSNHRRLTQGAGAQLILSLPQGAVNFAVLEGTRKIMGDIARRYKLLTEQGDKANDVVAACMDFMSSAASTTCCLLVSGPTTMIADNIMSGNYPNLNAAIAGISSQGGLEAFYTGWRPQLAAKIPSYGLTWVFFQRFKAAHNALVKRPLNDLENFAIGSIASCATVTLMMPMDTIKTRLVTQVARKGVVYNGIGDAAARIIQEEGPAALYRGLTPRLASVVPMVAIQFAAYEALKQKILEHKKGNPQKKDTK